MFSIHFIGSIAVGFLCTLLLIQPMSIIGTVVSHKCPSAKIGLVHADVSFAQFASPRALIKRRASSLFSCFEVCSSALIWALHQRGLTLGMK